MSRFSASDYGNAYRARMSSRADYIADIVALREVLGYEPEGLGDRIGGDAFTRMAAACGSRGGRAPYDERMRATGRAFAILTEAASSSAGRCQLSAGSASKSTLLGDGGRGRHTDVTRLLQVMHGAIGRGVAKPVIRSRLGRSPITVLELVTMVCVGGMTVSEVLRAKGWTDGGNNVGPLQDVLAQALGRMSLAVRSGK